jgi:replicative superfamily II helicase
MYVYFWILLQSGQSTFERKEFNSIESALLQSVYESDKNLMITLPLGFDKTNIILLAAYNLLAGPSSSFSIQKHQMKVTLMV